MPPVRSAGLLLYRRDADATRVLLAHMGGPFWARKDERAWSIPKGEYAEGDDPLAAARREFAEELGSPAPDVDLHPLGELRLPSGKRLTVWAGEADFDAATIVSNTFDLEWPPRSGRVQQFPEVDRAEWFEPDRARVTLVAGQVPFLDRLAGLLAPG